MGSSHVQINSAEVDKAKSYRLMFWVLQGRSEWLWPKTVSEFMLYVVWEAEVLTWHSSCDRYWPRIQTPMFQLLVGGVAGARIYLLVVLDHLHATSKSSVPNTLGKSILELHRGTTTYLRIRQDSHHDLLQYDLKSRFSPCDHKALHVFPCNLDVYIMHNPLKIEFVEYFVIVDWNHDTLAQSTHSYQCF